MPDAPVAAAKYRPDIDGLRAIAVCPVVVYHAFPSAIQGGFIGVDIFFVISGFLISTIIFRDLDHNHFKFTDFYARRIKRIFPALLLVLASCFAVGWFTLLATEYAQLGKHIAAGAVFLSNATLWQELGYFDTAAETKPLLHLWSLAVEEQFYLAWPLAVWLAHRQKFNLLSLAVAVAAVSFCVNMQYLGAGFYWPHARFWEMTCGSILAWLAFYKPTLMAVRPSKLNAWLTRIVYQQPRPNDGTTLANTASIAGFLLLLFGFWHLDKSFAFPGAWALIPVLGAALIIFAGASAWFNRTILSHKIMVTIGLISFPLYLWHWPLLSFARIIAGETPSVGVRLMAIAAAFVLAWLTYRFVERPMRFGKHGAFKVTLLLVTMALMGYIGYNTYKRHGLSFRFPAQVRNLATTIDFKWSDYIQYEQCHLQTPTTLNHQPQCYQPNKPSVVLWGDSHASSLYPGLKYLQSTQQFGLSQLTTAGCPPIFGLDTLLFSPQCNAINQNVWRGVRALKPDVIVLHAAWQHEHYPMTNDVLRQKLMQTLVLIKQQLPRTRIIMVGTVPRWNDSPQKVAFKFWQRSLDKTVPIPDYLQTTVLPDVDAVLAQTALEQGVEFIAPLQHLCKGTACLWRVDTQDDDIIAVDYGHLSKAGAIYLGDKIFTHLLTPPKP